MDVVTTDTPATTTVQAGYQTLHELVRVARQKLDPNLWDYLIGGTGTETTLARNRQALDALALRPRVLRDVQTIDPGADFLGRRIRLPVLLAPVGGLDSIAPDGNVRTGRAAAAFGVPFMLSSVTQTPLETVAASSSAPKVFQLYVRGDAAFIDEHVDRAMGAGFDAFCITVDSAIYSRRERDIARRYAKPWRGETPGMRHQAAFSWEGVRRIRDKYPSLKLFLKGIGTGEDAAIACESGVDVVYVSNHGGRQLDHGLGAIDVLPEVVDAVAGRARIVVDGGFSRGTDIVKAIALGADTVGLGRLYCYGLAAEGEDGIVRVLELLELEVLECLGLLGVSSLAGVRRSHVCAARPVTEPHVHSAFPLLHLPRQEY